MKHTLNLKLVGLVTVAFVGGALLSYWQLHSGLDPAPAVAPQPLYWVAPMDANFRRDKPGKSPMGMDLVPVYPPEEPSQTPGTVTISAAVANNLGVQLGEAVVEDLTLGVPTVGLIQFDEKSITHQHSRVEGWLESLAVTSVGDSVASGQLLYEIYSPALVNAQEEYLAALAGVNFRLLKASRRKLQALGVEDALIDALKEQRQVQQRLPFHSPRAGFIASLNVREGMFIKPATELLSVGSLAQVWVIAEIFERQAAWVKPGQQVRMTVDSYPDREWQGVVDYLYPVLEPQTRTLRARILFDNKDKRLKPNMFAQLHIEAGVRAAVVTIPRKAVIYQSGMSRVVKVTGDNQFRSVRVKTGTESGERIEIIEGLEAGDKVVISSQFLIDSESSVAADLSRIDGSSP